MSCWNLGFNSTCRKKKHSLFHRLMLLGLLILICMCYKRNGLSILGISIRGDGSQIFTLLKEKPPKGYMWSRKRLTKIKTTTRPDHVWPEVWTKIGKAAQNRERQEWAKEKPKLDNARKMRGSYFIDPDDQEYKDILKNARRKLERPMAPVPCKRQKSITKVIAKSNSASEENSKTVYSSKVESHESTRQRAESSASKHHKDHIVGKGFTSKSHLQIGTQVHPVMKSTKTSL